MDVAPTVPNVGADGAEGTRVVEVANDWLEPESFNATTAKSYVVPAVRPETVAGDESPVPADEYDPAPDAL